MKKLILISSLFLLSGGSPYAQTASDSSTGARGAGVSPEISNSRNPGSSTSTSSGDMDVKPNSVDTHPSGPNATEQTERNR